MDLEYQGYRINPSEPLLNIPYLITKFLLKIYGNYLNIP